MASAPDTHSERLATFTFPQTPSSQNVGNAGSSSQTGDNPVPISQGGENAGFAWALPYGDPSLMDVGDFIWPPPSASTNTQNLEDLWNPLLGLSPRQSSPLVDSPPLALGGTPFGSGTFRQASGGSMVSQECLFYVADDLKHRVAHVSRRLIPGLAQYQQTARRIVHSISGVTSTPACLMIRHPNQVHPW